MLFVHFLILFILWKKAANTKYKGKADSLNAKLARRSSRAASAIHAGAGNKKDMGRLDTMAG